MAKNRIMCLSVLLCVVILLLIRGVYYLGSKNNQNSSANLQQKKTINTESMSQEVYTNSVYSFTLEYPKYLSNYVRKDNNSFTIDYPGMSDVPLFSLDIIKTAQDPIVWWNQVGSKSYSWIFNTAFNDVGVGEKSNIKAKQIIGQRKSPGGAILSASLFIIPGESYLLVVSENSSGLGDGGSILSSLRFTL